MPKEKINVGMAFYGRTFKFVDPSKNYLGAPAKGPGAKGPVSLHYFSYRLKLTKNLFPYLKSIQTKLVFFLTMKYVKIWEKIGFVYGMMNRKSLMPIILLIGLATMIRKA